MVYKFITFEGNEGAGKGTQTARLKEFYEKKLSKEVLVTFEPGDTKIGMLLRDILQNPDTPQLDPHEQAVLYYLERKIHLNEVVIPALKQNKTVLCDRYDDATTVYQHFAGGMPLRDLLSLKNKVAPNFLPPDITLFLDVPSVEEGLERSSKKEFGKPDKMESKGLGFHEKVREGYLWIAKQEPERFKIITPGDEDFVFSQILKELGLEK